VSRIRPRNRGSVASKSKRFCSFQSVHSGSRSHQPLTQRVMGLLSSGIKWLANKANYYPPSSAKVKIERSSTSTFPYAFIAWTGTILLGQLKIWLWVSLNGITFMPNFVKIGQRFRKLNWSRTHTQNVDLICPNFSCSLQNKTVRLVRRSCLTVRLSPRLIH
jgi:hypothetical protein